MRRLAAVLVMGFLVGGCAGVTVPAARFGGVLEPPPPAPTPPPPPPPGEGDAASVATDLGRVETAIRDPATPEAELDPLGRRQQELYRVLFARPEWQPAVVAGVPAGVRPAVEANLVADAELAHLGEPRPELPHWRIVAPAPAAELLADYKAAAARTSVPWPYLAAIHLVETRMGRIRGASSAGAQGPMQFLPSTWAVYGAGGDIDSNADAIAAAARMLGSQGAPANMARALFAYNNSDHYVRAITAYAGVMAADERAYAAYHAWQVYYGDRLLPEGWSN